MCAHVVHELHGRRGVARRHITDALRHVVVQHLVGGYLARQPTRFAEARHAHQHVAVVFLDELGVDAELARGDLEVPAAGERLPRALQLFDGEVTEVGLEQLALVVAELHVEVAVELAGLVLFGGQGDGVDALAETKKQLAIYEPPTNTLYINSPETPGSLVL